MSKTFNDAMRPESAIKTCNIYFHPQHADAAIELGSRIQADGLGQVVVTRTQGNRVFGPNDVGAVDSILLDTGMGAQLADKIVDLHDRLRYPYEVHRVTYNPGTKVFERATDVTVSSEGDLSGPNVSAPDTRCEAGTAEAGPVPVSHNLATGGRGARAPANRRG